MNKEGEGLPGEGLERSEPREVRLSKEKEVLNFFVGEN